MDYYQLLGISSEAGDEEIKAAYRRLARLYHPDTNKDPEAAARFIEIRAAYEVLIDPDRRKAYDEQYLVSMPIDHVGIARAGRRRAFPHFMDIGPLVIRLKTMVYALSAQDAHRLRRDGLLRGVAPWTDDAACYCHRCQHRWAIPVIPTSPQFHSLPAACPQCQATDWSEFLLLHCLHCDTVFECEGPLREAAGEVASDEQAGRLFFPYDLFPLCPYCERGAWCRAEDKRTAALEETL